jgi:transcriptional regulator with XRE-family HTH domain
MESTERRGVDMDGPEVRRRRKLRGEERRDFADRIEVTPGYLSLLERGARKPSPTVFARICDALDVAEENRHQLVRTSAEAGAS